MIKYKSKNSFITFLFSVVSLFIVLLLSAFLAFLFIVPVSNYYHTPGIVEYEERMNIISEFDGIIDCLYVDNGEFIKKDSSILKYSSEQDKRDVLKLEVQKKYVKNEIYRLNRLKESGYVQKSEIDLKKMAMEELDILINFKQKNKLTSPGNGILYYEILPNEITGTFVSKGQKIASLFIGEKKIIHISLLNEQSDKIQVGTEVIIKYREPGSFSYVKMKGLVYKKDFEIGKNKVHLYCKVNNSISLKRLPHSTIVRTSILVNRQSVLEDLLKVDVYPIVKSFLSKIKVVNKFKSIIYRDFD